MTVSSESLAESPADLGPELPSVAAAIRAALLAGEPFAKVRATRAVARGP